MYAGSADKIFNSSLNEADCLLPAECLTRKDDIMRVLGHSRRVWKCVCKCSNYLRVCVWSVTYMKFRFSSLFIHPFEWVTSREVCVSDCMSLFPQDVHVDVGLCVAFVSYGSVWSVVNFAWVSRPVFRLAWNGIWFKFSLYRRSVPAICSDADLNLWNHVLIQWNLSPRTPLLSDFWIQEYATIYSVMLRYI